MANKSFHLEVITPDKTAVEGDAVSLQVTAADGKMGVWPDHAPLIAMLGVGELFCRDEQGKEQTFALGEGFIEVQNNQVKVLCDFAESPEDIDVERAQEAEKRARERLKRRTEQEIDVLRAEFALQRAILRLKLAKYGR